MFAYCRTRSARFALVAGLGLAVGLSATLAVAPERAAAQTAAKVPESPAQIKLSFAPIVKKAAPAVVNIRALVDVGTGPQGPMFNDPFFRRFFGQNGPGQRPRRGALGSGVIVRADGVVITNFHVISKADRVQVILHDKREFEAKILLKDKRTDLAVLKIDTKGEKLPSLELRDADELEVGDLVLAIGNPFGVGQTVTSGIVSGLARTTIGITDYRFFIQTDAAINPGNSGGALVTLDGKLVGINTAIYSKSGGSIGIGFAIPSNMVRAVLTAAEKGGPIRRPWLGASGQNVTAEIAASLGLKTVGGVIIKEVQPDGPAAKAGLRPSDIVLRLNGKGVPDGEGLRFRLATLSVGGTATLTVRRGKELVTLTLKLEAAPMVPPQNRTMLSGYHPFAGAMVANLSPGFAEQIGSRRTKGVVVVQIRSGSVAQRIRLRPGDIVLQVNGRDVDSVRTLRELVAQDSYPWRIAIQRGNRVIRATLRL